VRSTKCGPLNSKEEVRKARLHLEAGGHSRSCAQNRQQDSALEKSRLRNKKVVTSTEPRGRAEKTNKGLRSKKKGARSKKGKTDLPFTWLGRNHSRDCNTDLERQGRIKKNKNGGTETTMAVSRKDGGKVCTLGGQCRTMKGFTGSTD